jgi:hypothetical protein
MHIGLTAIGCIIRTKEFAFCEQLGMDFQTHYGFKYVMVVHGVWPRIRADGIGPAGRFEGRTRRSLLTSLQKYLF